MSLLGSESVGQLSYARAVGASVSGYQPAGCALAPLRGARVPVRVTAKLVRSGSDRPAAREELLIRE